MGSATIKNPADFASALLGALGLPDTKTNVTNIVGWEAAEGGNWNNSAKYNPLNTQMQEPNSTSMGGGSKVQSYTSWQEGLNATVSTLDQSGFGYSKILADLNTSAPWITFKKSVKASGWDGSSHYQTNGVFNSPNPPSGAPSASAYNTGTSAATSTNIVANSPGKGGADLTGFAGVLQELQAAYNPTGVNSKIWGFIPNIPSDINSTLTMLMVRGFSSLIFTVLIGVGINTLIHGESSGGGGGGRGPTNVLEFINASQQGNTRNALAKERIGLQASKEEHTQQRHENKLTNDALARDNRVKLQDMAAQKQNAKLKNDAANRRHRTARAREATVRHQERIKNDAANRRARQKLASKPRVVVRSSTIRHIKGDEI